MRTETPQGPEHRVLQAILLSLLPVASVVAGGEGLGIAASLCLASAIFLLEGAYASAARGMVALGLVLVVVGGMLQHADAPATVLWIALWAGQVGLHLWPISPAISPSLPPTAPSAPHIAAARALLSAQALCWLTGLDEPWGALPLLVVGAMIPPVLSAPTWRAWLALAFPPLTLAMHLQGLPYAPGSALLVVGPLLLLSETLTPQRLGVLRQMATIVLASPARLLVLSFAALCLLGTLLLSHPFADTQGEGHSLLDAAFTAVSASCVTGLAVLDTPHAFTPFGQVILALLIQVGGLGIMTFAAAALLVAGRRLTLREEAAAADLLGADARANLRGALGSVLRVTLWTEALGAAFLAPLFWLQGDGVGEGLWRALFTAISAFCNAGFALQSDSLVGYQRSPAILGVISVLIVLGALGPAAVAALPLLWRRWRRQVSERRIRIEIWLTYLVTAVLLLGPAVAFFLLERAHTLAGMGLRDQMANAWFQSVTLRTAGFNSVDLAQVSPATLLLLIAVMFVGGSSGSTAGGIKTTTLAVLLLAVLAAARGRPEATIWGRRIPHSTIYKAAAITTVAVFSGFSGLTALLLTQQMPLDVALFEVVSALATVGLSIGGTAALDDVGKVIILICMFIGRVGPLTLFIFLTEQTARPSVEYPLEEVAVG